MKTIDELNYNLVNLKCALVDVEVKHGVHKRSTTGASITSLVNKLIKLVTTTESLVNEIEEAGSAAYTALTMNSEAGYLLDIANRCRFVYTARQRKRILEALEVIYTALTNQLAAAQELLAAAPAVEVSEITYAAESIEVNEVNEVNEVIITSLLSIYFTSYFNEKGFSKWNLIKNPSQISSYMIKLLLKGYLRRVTLKQSQMLLMLLEGLSKTSISNQTRSGVRTARFLN